MRASGAASYVTRFFRTRWHGGVAAGLWIVAAPLVALAQQPASPPGLRGVVVDSGGRPLDDAEVGVPAVGTVRTDAAGRFALPPRTYAFPLALAVRRVGFLAQTVTVTTADTALRVVLRSASQVLDTVRVAAEARSPLLIANGFYERQRKTHGRHLDSLALRQYVSAGLAGVLRETNRVSVRRIGTDDYAYTSMAGRPCRMNVFIDGRYEYATRPGHEAVKTRFRMEGVGLRELISFDAILSIEIYPSVNSVPSQFQRVGSAAGGLETRGASQIASPGGAPASRTTNIESGDAACGAIVIWTKRVEGAPAQ